MVNAFRSARAAYFFILLAALGWCALSAINCDSAVRHASPLFSLAITSTAGQEEFGAYCAGCHGQDRRGKGRSSAYCTVPPSDLTQLAQRNHGIYPVERVCDVLRRGTGRPPRGQGYMPVWEPFLKSMNADAPGVTELRIQNLAKYVRTLQEDSTAAQKHPAPVR